MQILRAIDATSSQRFDSARPPIEHRVKSWPAFFHATLDGVKTHDVRRMGDRDYQVGDTLRLMEFDPEKQQFTGRELCVRITYMTSAKYPVRFLRHACIPTIAFSVSQNANCMRRSVVGFVGVSGFAGSGKTTAVEYLSSLTGGRGVYFGRIVLSEVRARGLEETRENERKVRIDLRSKKGPAAVATLCVTEVAECIENGIPAFIDAILKREEFELLTSRFPRSPARLLAIEASFDTRRKRLACRAERPYNPDELLKRDKTELKELETGTVMAAADYTVRNEGTMEEYYLALAEFVSSCG